MPGARDILEHLHEVSREALGLAIAWHVIVAVASTALALGWRPERSHVGRALSLPVLSAASMAWLFGNPFNGTVLFGVALLLWITGGAGTRGRAEMAATWVSPLAIGLACFGWFYPPFIDVSKPLDVLFAAPMGLIPCPTLALVLGFSLLFESSTRRAWKIILALAGGFYGSFGWWALGVDMDAILLAGSVLVMARAIRARDPVLAPETKDPAGASRRP